MAYSERELLARMIQCEAGGEGDIGMKAVASVIMNRVNVPVGEYSRISQNGNIRNILFQECQFDCARETLGNQYNPQNIYNMNPTEENFYIADWALSGNRLIEAGECLWYLNPFKPTCDTTFPRNGYGTFHTRINNHCFIGLPLLIFYLDLLKVVICFIVIFILSSFCLLQNILIDLECTIIR